MNFTRHERQILLEKIGKEGQQKLYDSRVLVIGAGGLGSPVLFYLAAAGIGTIGIVDFDVVSLSNLNRQILHTTADIDRPKTLSAMEKLSAIDPDINFIRHEGKLTEENITDILSDYDVIVDCVDNLDTRLMVGKYCAKLKKPLVEGGVDSFSGFVMSILPDTACFGCMNSATPPARKIPIIGACAGVGGSIEASECIKLLLGIGKPITNSILFYDLLSGDFTRLPIQKSPCCPICGAKQGE